MLPSAINILEQHQSPNSKPTLLGKERTAIHSGKLGDIIYALPTCRALGVNHLYLNSYLPKSDPLRAFPVEAARQIIPLLLSQDYIDKVTLTQSDFALETLGPRFPGIDYNLDVFRLVARHRIGKVIQHAEKFTRYFENDLPAHLGEHFSAPFGFAVNLVEPWLKVSATPSSRTIVSITTNWRTYPHWYWRELLDGIPELYFVGHPKEFEAAKIPHAQFLETRNHLELAEAIASAKEFLGTVSFPYAIAEGLKVPRAVEVCQRNLNAFPVGPNGRTLPPALDRGRRSFPVGRPLSWIRRKILEIQSLTWVANHTLPQTLVRLLRGHICKY